MSGPTSTSLASFGFDVPSGRVPAIPDHELLRCIGAGSYGEVWLARSALGTFRAVKIVRRAAFDHDRPYEREFAGLQKFEPLSRNHEGFVDLLQVGRNDAEGWFYYVMELADPVDGEAKEEIRPESYRPLTLASRVKLRGACPLNEAIPLARTLASALTELHRHGLVHRDIKPSNLIFVNGVPKLADVGLVAAAKGVGQDRTFVGTEGFIPPEGPGTPRADLYSLGIVLYVLGTGKSHRDFPEPPADLATRPDRERWLEFSAVIHRAAAADPKQRYASAQDLLADLERLTAGQSVRHHRMRRRVGRWVVLGGLGAGAVASLLWFLSRPPSGNALPSGLGWTTNKEAIAAWEKANYLQGTGRPESTATAGQYLKEAIRLDPKFAYAYASLANNANAGINQGYRETLEAFPEAEGHVRHALQLEPDLTWAHVVHAELATTRDHAWKDAEAEFRRALERQQGLGSRIRSGLAGAVLVPQARFDEALREVATVLERDPSDLALNAQYCQALYYARRYDQALVQSDQLLVLQPAHRWGRSLRARNLLVLGRTNEAVALYRQLVREAPDMVWLQAALFHAQTLAGQSPPEGPTLDQLLDRADQPRAALGLALAYTALNDHPNALIWLEHAYDRRDPELRWLKVEPRFDPLRSERGFQDLLKKMNLAP